MVRFERVSKNWGDNHVLRELDFSVNKGDKISIIGPSGSGKTTILRVLMTLEHPTSGRVLVEGDELWNTDDARKRPRETRRMRQIRSRIGMVFQQFNLFPHMTALENVMEAPVHVLGKDKGTARREAEELLGLVGLAEHSFKKPPQLSGGQQQRVAIARAMATKPDIMLFDEPTSALDPELVGEVLKVIRDLANDSSMTMLMVTHEMNFAREISDLVVMFDQGVAVEVAPPDRLFDAPENERTKRFLGAVLGY
ncbi:amino acid ABC transporter ATP-binding protein [Dietzia sp. B32]|uniref:amino acid ABC transporter ATP-binding protein n=1 Tax=Dietzia sp. B32 TaxID=2915130 RepID=UPI0021ADB76A|nr:amino acid ABC transporter ATP-binding protein [Dietzia sp. B32]UVE97022.1 amino acid ABC transporter ATP-binding protein [Dietzia sp. B32]